MNVIADDFINALLADATYALEVSVANINTSDSMLGTGV